MLFRSNIASSIASLATNARKISGITVTDGTVQSPAVITMTAAQITTLGSKLTGNYSVSLSDAITAAQVATTLASNTKISSVAVSDTAANIASSIASLATNASKISGITVTDGTVQSPAVITMTAAQITTLGSKLADRKSTRLNSSHSQQSRMPSSA